MMCMYSLLFGHENFVKRRFKERIMHAHGSNSQRSVPWATSLANIRLTNSYYS
jgi:hypothetical protein